ncbi:MAG: hypothetical protein DRI90_03170 [Deltaproteobacteria bacterium]|nr:MAG: hypothetical protein DRI90_03170 [Deltaproteobacteria bacterium]
MFWIDAGLVADPVSTVDGAGKTGFGAPATAPSTAATADVGRGRRGLGPAGETEPHHREGEQAA